jgi:hypothetical protein
MEWRRRSYLDQIWCKEGEGRGQIRQCDPCIRWASGSAAERQCARAARPSQSRTGAAAALVAAAVEHDGRVARELADRRAQLRLYEGARVIALFYFLSLS